jgi:hypothetical protein
MRKKIMKLLWSKWFYYLLTAILLLTFIILTGYGTLHHIDIAERFLPTFVGLFITVVIFYIFFDLREELEWKEVEGRVKRRIGSEIFDLFTLLRDFCEVDKSWVGGDSRDIEAFKKSERKQLKQMTEKIVLIGNLADDLITKKSLGQDYALMVDKIRVRISESEEKYGRFFSPKLRVSLMDVQDYLVDFRIELKLGTFGSNKTLSQSLSSIIGKLAKEINNIVENGIDIFALKPKDNETQKS